MYLMKPRFEILSFPEQMLEQLELYGRVCYKSEDRISEGSAERFVRMLVHTYQHESVIEHCNITVKFIVDRGVSHELVRHRLCSFSQESTRYCNYTKKGVIFIIPPWVNVPEGEFTHDTVSTTNTDDEWFDAMLRAETSYKYLMENGWTAQQARSVLPNSLKTEVVTTANLREWRHILKLRTAKTAHPQMREVMVPLLLAFQQRLPVIFDNIGIGG